MLDRDAKDYCSNTSCIHIDGKKVPIAKKQVLSTFVIPDLLHMTLYEMPIVQ